MLLASCLDGENVKMTHFINLRDWGSCLNALTSHRENKSGREEERKIDDTVNGRCMLKGVEKVIKTNCREVYRKLDIAPTIDL